MKQSEAFLAIAIITIKLLTDTVFDFFAKELYHYEYLDEGIIFYANVSSIVIITLIYKLVKNTLNQRFNLFFVLIIIIANSSNIILLLFDQMLIDNIESKTHYYIVFAIPNLLIAFSEVILGIQLFINKANKWVKPPLRLLGFFYISVPVFKILIAILAAGWVSDFGPNTINGYLHFLPLLATLNIFIRVFKKSSATSSYDELLDENFDSF